MSEPARELEIQAQEAAPAEAPSRWVTVHLAGETYGIEVMNVQEVLRVPEIAPVPGAPDFVLGIINLRGHVVTVIDTRRRFGLPPAEHDEQTRIVIVEVDGQVFGMVVDSVAEVVDIRRSDIDTAPMVQGEEAAPYLQGVAHLDGRLLILIDLRRIIEDDAAGGGLGF